MLPEWAVGRRVGRAVDSVAARLAQVMPAPVVPHMPTGVVVRLPSEAMLALVARGAGASGRSEPPLAPREAQRLHVYRSLLTGSHAHGVRGTVVFWVSSADLGADDVGQACAIGRHLLAHGYGVVIADRWTKLPPRALAVVGTTPRFDPNVVPGDVLAMAWVIDEPSAWYGNPSLSLCDAVLAGSGQIRLRLSQLLGAERISLLPPVADGDDWPDAAPPSSRFRRSPRRGIAVTPRGEGDGLVDAAVRIARRRPLFVLAPPAFLTPALRMFALPSIDPVHRRRAFGSAMVAVVDSPVAAESGLVPLAVLEALAAGALPLVSSRLGLAELGLEKLPSFRGADELSTELHRLLAEADDTRALAHDLAERVRREHTADARTREFVDILDGLRARHAGPGAAATSALTVGFHPDARVTNPYQDMLYADLQRRGVRLAPVRWAVDSAVLRDTGGDLHGYALHLHWTSAIVQIAGTEAEGRGRLEAFRARVLDLQARGGALVWTVHNVLPHECPYRELEIELCRFLAERADVVHVLCDETFAATRPLYELDPARTLVVPHSSYDGIYPDVVTRRIARERLGVARDDIALLSVGGIRPYRGLDTLLDAFDVLVAEEPRLRLLVAGKPGDWPGIEDLRARCAGHPRITAQFQHLPTDDLQLWNRAADVAVLPYRHVLNSGAFKLAQTYGLPIVAPRDGCVARALDPSHTFGFDPGDAQGLPAALRSAIALARDPAAWHAASTAARAAAAAYPPSAMAADFAEGLLSRIPSTDAAEPTPIA